MRSCGSLVTRTHCAACQHVIHQLVMTGNTCVFGWVAFKHTFSYSVKCPVVFLQFFHWFLHKLVKEEWRGHKTPSYVYETTADTAMVGDLHWLLARRHQQLSQWQSISPFPRVLSPRYSPPHSAVSGIQSIHSLSHPSSSVTAAFCFTDNWLLGSVSSQYPLANRSAVDTSPIPTMSWPFSSWPRSQIKSSQMFCHNCHMRQLPWNAYFTSP